MASIGGMNLRLTELQELNKKAQKLMATEELQKGWININRMLHYQGLLFLPKIIQTELISRHYDNLLAGHFNINKTREFISWKYY